MASDISLSAGQRSSLVALRDIDRFLTRTQKRLASGQRVNDVADDPGAFFAARGLSNRAALFVERRDAIEQGIETLNSALDGLETVENLFRQIIGIIDEARGQLNLGVRAAATDDLQEVVDQIRNIVNDANYRGLNLISNNNARLTIRFSDNTASRIQVAGANGLFSAGAFFTGQVAQTQFVGSLFLSEALGFTRIGFTLGLGSNLSLLSRADIAVERTNTAIVRLQTRAATLGARAALLQERSLFSQDYATTLATGSDKLTLADLNEEGANLTALRTRNQIGVEALAVTSSQQSAILTLFSR